MFRTGCWSAGDARRRSSWTETRRGRGRPAPSLAEGHRLLMNGSSLRPYCTRRSSRIADDPPRSPERTAAGRSAASCGGPGNGCSSAYVLAAHSSNRSRPEHARRSWMTGAQCSPQSALNESGRRSRRLAGRRTSLPGEARERIREHARSAAGIVHGGLGTLWQTSQDTPSAPTPRARDGSVSKGVQPGPGRTRRSSPSRAGSRADSPVRPSHARSGPFLEHRQEERIRRRGRMRLAPTPRRARMALRTPHPCPSPLPIVPLARRSPHNRDCRRAVSQSTMR
jgi:hypothetical protein